MMLKRLELSVAVMVLVSACGGSNSPTAPPVITGTVGARIDAGCSGPRWNITSVTVTIDGVDAGTAAPGGSVTRVLPVGSHRIAGRSNNSLVAWGGDTWVTTAANPDRIEFFACL